MNIDEAISHAEEKSKGCGGNCAYEHRQLAEWLRELKELRGMKKNEKDVDTK